MKRTEEERHKLCLGLYEGEKSRNFMLHLVRSYSQLNKVSVVKNFNEKQKPKCAICEVKLFSADEAIASEDIKTKPGFALAVSGDETDTCLCAECSTAVHVFTLTKIVEGDVGINRTVKDMRDKQSGVVREQRITHRNVQASTTLGSLPGFSTLLEKFGK